MATQSLAEVWYIHYVKGGQPTPIRIGLAADGSADLSPLPEDVREHLSDFGVPDELHQDRVFATEGSRFLKRLLEEPSRYMVFRSSPGNV